MHPKNITLTCQVCGQSFTVPAWRPNARTCGTICRNKLPRPRGISPETRFWEQVQKDEGCWSWTGNTCKGYGRFIVAGTLYHAHRFSWELVHGPVPEGLCVLHTCDNPGCTNPAHLFLGTKGDNNTDRNDKGRTIPPRGENHHSAKLAEADIREIRRLHAAGAATQAELAATYGISRGNLCLIVQRKIWRNVR